MKLIEKQPRDFDEEYYLEGVCGAALVVEKGIRLARDAEAVGEKIEQELDHLVRLAPAGWTRDQVRRDLITYTLAYIEMTIRHAPHSMGLVHEYAAAQPGAVETG